VKADPFEINNLAVNPEYADVLKKMRSHLDTWMEETNDHGREGESPEMYDSDMAEYFKKFEIRPELKGKDRPIRENIELMKKWAAEGK
jgi:hypothetical protein